MLSQPQINLFCVFARIEHTVILSFKQTESDKINTLGIFGSFILSVQGKRQHAKIGRFSTIDKLSVQLNYANSGLVCLIVHLTNFPV